MPNRKRCNVFVQIVWCQFGWIKTTAGFEDVVSSCVYGKVCVLLRVFLEVHSFAMGNLAIVRNVLILIEEVESCVTHLSFIRILLTSRPALVKLHGDSLLRSQIHYSPLVVVEKSA